MHWAVLAPDSCIKSSMTYLLYFYRPALSRVETGALVPRTRRCVCCRDADRPDSGRPWWIFPSPPGRDNLKSKWGRRRPLMILGFIPTILSFLLLWYPPLSGEQHWRRRALGERYLCRRSQFTVFLLPYAYYCALSGVAFRDRPG